MHAAAAHQRNPDLTRQTLLQAAFDEIYVHGFQGARLDRILENTGVTKGALYHHFRNKLELGYAVIDEVIKPMVVTEWVQALADTDDPLEAIVRTIQKRRKEHGEAAAVCGCPLNNLAMEMSPIDEGFRRRIQALFDSWRRGIASALRPGARRLPPPAPSAEPPALNRSCRSGGRVVMWIRLRPLVEYSTENGSPFTSMRAIRSAGGSDVAGRPST